MENVTEDNLNDVMEFDHVIRIHADGTITEPRNVYAPNLYDGHLDQAPWHRWELLNGFSGQHGYSGPLMHQSEFIGGGMARYILDNPGLYVAIVNQNSDDSEPTEWAVAYIPEPEHDDLPGTV